MALVGFFPGALFPLSGVKELTPSALPRAGIFALAKEKIACQSKPDIY